MKKFLLTGLFAVCATVSSWANALDTTHDGKLCIAWFMDAPLAHFDHEIVVRHLTDSLSKMTGLPTEVIPITIEAPMSLLGWSVSASTQESRELLFGEGGRVDQVIVAPQPQADKRLFAQSLLALSRLMPSALPRPWVISAQKPAYAMRKLFNQKTCVTLCQQAQRLSLNFIPVDLTWQRVYTDDLFEDRIKPSTDCEAYVYAGAIATWLTDGKTPPAYVGSASYGDKLAQSVARAYAKDRQAITSLAGFWPDTQFEEVPEALLPIYLMPGVLESLIKPELEACAKKDARTLRFMEQPCANTIFIGHFSQQSTPVGSRIIRFIRPLFNDPTASKDLNVIDAKLSVFKPDAGYVPFDYACVQAYQRNLISSYPLFGKDQLLAKSWVKLLAVQVYAELTGSIVLPDDLPPPLADIAIESYLQWKTALAAPNALLTAYTTTPTTITMHASLWRKPQTACNLSIATLAPQKEVSLPLLKPINATFNASTKTQLLWAIQPAFDGIQSGNRSFIHQAIEK